MKNARFLALAALLLVAYARAGLECVLYYSPTYDEPAHLAAGYSYLVRQDFRLDHDVPPLTKELAALPVLAFEHLPFSPRKDMWGWTDQFEIGKEFLFDSAVPVDRIMLLARLPMLGLGLALAGLTGWWAHRLWGPAAGLTALALAVVDPNLLAHSCLVNSDVAAALFSTLALYLLWENFRRPSLRRLFDTGLATGLALSSKFSSITLLAALAITGAGWVLAGGALLPTAPATGAQRRRLGSLLLAPAAVAAGATIVIPLFYFFCDGGGFFNWFDGLSWVRNHLAVGHPTFFLGEYSLKGWWLYFPVAFLVKTPIGSLAMIGLSLVLWRRGERLALREALALLVPPAVFMVAAIGSPVNIGLRHIFPVYPFLYVLAARLATVPFRGTAPSLWLLLPIALAAASSFRVAPYQLAYFNELAGGPSEGYLYLSDSNLDWGQDLKALAVFVEREKLGTIYLSYYGAIMPARYGLRYRPLPGDSAWDADAQDQLPPDNFPSGKTREVLAISVSNLQGLWPPRLRRDYGWLLERQPITRLGYGIWVYDLTGDAAAHVRLAEIYMRWNHRQMAAKELSRALELDPKLAAARKVLRYLERHPGAGITRGSQHPMADGR